MLKKLQSKKGFTLMEMLIVVAIIAVLVAIAIPVFNGALTKSKEAADVANVRATYAEWQTAMLTENTKAPTDKDAFLKGHDNGTAIVLTYGDLRCWYRHHHLQSYQADRREWCKDLHLDAGYARHPLTSICHIHTHSSRTGPTGPVRGDPSLIGRGWPWVGVPPRSVRTVPSKGEPSPCCMPIPS